MLNLFTGVGRLTKDPELRKNAQSDKSFVNFAVAFDSPTTNEDGERNTTFLDAVAFDQRAELIAKSLHKGSRVAISGGLNQRDFLRQDGSKGRVYEIIVNSIVFLDPKREEPEYHDDDDDGSYDSTGSLSGEEYEDEDGKVQKLQAIPPKAKFDPMTGKPLTKPAKKQ